MVGHRPLKASILVRIQVPQPTSASAVGAERVCEVLSVLNAGDEARFILCIMST